MKTWDNIKKNISNLNDADKMEIELIESIIARRVELGLSQRDLVKLTGLKQTAIARFETMKVSPQLNTIVKMIKPLGLKLLVEKE